MLAQVLGTAGAFILAVIFLTSSIWKMRNPHLFERSLKMYLSVSPPVVGWLVALTELAIGVALLAGVYVEYTAAIASIILVAFAIGTARVIASKADAACGCGGVLGSGRVGFATLLRNAILASGAGILAMHAATAAAVTEDLVTDPASLNALYSMLLLGLAAVLIIRYGLRRDEQS